MQPDQKRQHLIWRAPVNTSKELFQIRYGEIVLTVRPAKLVMIAEAARRLAACLSVGRKGAALKSPFVRLSRDLVDPAHGSLRHDVYALATDADIARDIDLIHQATPGELWGLTAVLYADPTRPEPELTPTSA